MRVCTVFVSFVDSILRSFCGRFECALDGIWFASSGANSHFGSKALLRYVHFILR